MCLKTEVGLVPIMSRVLRQLPFSESYKISEYILTNEVTCGNFQILQCFVYVQYVQQKKKAYLAPTSLFNQFTDNKSMTMFIHTYTMTQ